MDTNKTLPTPLNVTFKRPFYYSQGWEDIGNLTGQHSAPFQLYNDDGKTFLQVRNISDEMSECIDTIKLDATTYTGLPYLGINYSGRALNLNLNFPY